MHKDLCNCRDCMQKRREERGILYIDYDHGHGWYVMDHGRRTNVHGINEAKRQLNRLKKMYEG